MKQRKQKLIKTRLQLRLIIAFTSLACLAALFQVLLLEHSLSRISNDGVTGGDLRVDMAGLMISNLLITLAVLLPLMLIVGILITHRIAGPIYRFERYMEQLARGEYEGPCRIRKGDELQELCKGINAAVDRLRESNSSSEPTTEAA